MKLSEEKRKKISELSNEEQQELLHKIQQLVHESPPEVFKLRREGNKKGETIPGLPYSVIKLFDENHQPRWFILDAELGSGATGKVKIAYPIHIKERSLTQRERWEIGDPCVMKVSNKIYEPFGIEERRQEFDVVKTTEGNSIHAFNVREGVDREMDYTKVYFTQELGKGTELLKLIKEGAFKDKSIEELLKIMRNIAEALADIHAKGITHRDIKPENILVDIHTGSVKIIDFGSARIHEKETDYSGITQLYAAPEIFTHENARKQNVSPSQDVFALGATLMAILYSRVDPNSHYENDLDYYERCGLFKPRSESQLEVEKIAQIPFDIQAYKDTIQHKTGKDKAIEESLIGYLETLTSVNEKGSEMRKSTQDSVFVFDQMIKVATAEKQRRYDLLEKVYMSSHYSDLLKQLNKFELEKKWSPFLSGQRKEHLTHKIRAITSYLNELDKCLERFRLAQNPQEEASALKALREFSFESVLTPEQSKIIRSKQNPNDHQKSNTQKLLEKFEWHTLVAHCDQYEKMIEDQAPVEAAALDGAPVSELVIWSPFESQWGQELRGKLGSAHEAYSPAYEALIVSNAALLINSLSLESQKAFLQDVKEHFEELRSITPDFNTLFITGINKLLHSSRESIDEGLQALLKKDFPSDLQNEVNKILPSTQVTEKEKPIFIVEAYLKECAPFMELKKHFENLKEEYPQVDAHSQVGEKIKDLGLYIYQVSQISENSLEGFYKKLKDMHPHNTAIYSNLGNDLYKVFHPGEKSRSEGLIKALEGRVLKDIQKSGEERLSEKEEGEGESAPHL